MKRFALLLTLLLFSPNLFARDLHGRLGLGYNAEFANSRYARVPGVSLKYGLTHDFAIAGIFGTSTHSPANTVAAGKFFKNIFLETNLNFYFFGGVGFVQAISKTGVDFISGFGAEFFIPGVESLGLSFETGAGLDNLTGSMALRTIGASFVDAGIHFYF